ncbi:hypothetical protein HBB16_04060 [Pseudonocardia sp. MCCB 268]|nr:hypothetical protein [Pseudonocardia cytotoxica]
MTSTEHWSASDPCPCTELDALLAHRVGTWLDLDPDSFRPPPAAARRGGRDHGERRALLGDLASRRAESPGRRSGSGPTGSTCGCPGRRLPSWSPPRSMTRPASRPGCGCSTPTARPCTARTWSPEPAPTVVDLDGAGAPRAEPPGSAGVEPHDPASSTRSACLDAAVTGESIEWFVPPASPVAGFRRRSWSCSGCCEHVVPAGVRRRTAACRRRSRVSRRGRRRRRGRLRARFAFVRGRRRGPRGPHPRSAGPVSTVLRLVRTAAAWR